MIDILKAKKAFAEYANLYADEENIGIDKMKMKIAHMERVAGLSKNIAIRLNLSEEDIMLAQLIGLLHDIGRFEQIKKYNTYSDKDSVNHGQLGVQILFEDNLIREFIEDDKYDEIIKISILNHNKNKSDIEYDKLSEKEILHTKIIRDSDKTDILYILTFEEKGIAWESESIDDNEITEEIYNNFIVDREINYKNRKTHVDLLVSHLAFIFDFNFKSGLEYIDKKEYYKKIYERFKFTNSDTQNKIYEIYQITQEYIKEKTK